MKRIHDFEQLCQYVDQYSVEQILVQGEKESDMDSRLRNYERSIVFHEMRKGNRNAVTDFAQHKKQYHEWFKWTQCMDPTYNKYYRILLQDLVQNIAKYRRTFELLEDEVSRKVFFDICYWRLVRQSHYLVDAFYLSENEQYFEPFEKLGGQEVFVDCGGWIGDSVDKFIQYTGAYRKIFLYEADEENIRKAQNNLRKYDNIIYRSVGVGEKHENLKFNATGLSSSSFDCNNDEGGIVEVVPLDDDIQEEITFVKMDVEGMELSVLRGSVKHIQQDRPVLAVCLYHNPEDIYEIPLFIDSITNKYKYYIRHYTLHHGETVLYAVPQER